MAHRMQICAAAARMDDDTALRTSLQETLATDLRSPVLSTPFLQALKLLVDRQLCGRHPPPAVDGAAVPERMP